jgi:hypothetical protein
MKKIKDEKQKTIFFAISFLLFLEIALQVLSYLCESRVGCIK